MSKYTLIVACLSKFSCFLLFSLLLFRLLFSLNPRNPITEERTIREFANYLNPPRLPSFVVVFVLQLLLLLLLLSIYPSTSILLLCFLSFLRFLCFLPGNFNFSCVFFLSCSVKTPIFPGKATDFMSDFSYFLFLFHHFPLYSTQAATDHTTRRDGTTYHLFLPPSLPYSNSLSGNTL